MVGRLPPKGGECLGYTDDKATHVTRIRQPVFRAGAAAQAFASDDRAERRETKVETQVADVVKSEEETITGARSLAPRKPVTRTSALTGLLIVVTSGLSLVSPQIAVAGFVAFDQLVPSQPQTPHPAVARVIVPEQGAVSHGSGTLVDVHGDYGLIVTNWHVVRDSAGDVMVVFPNGFRSAGRVLKVDKDWDLAVLAIWRPSVAPMPLAHAPPQPGDVLTIAGYGQGQYRAATGRCTQYVAPGADLPYEMVEVSASARQGDSGGPIINQRGELAGVLFGSTRNATSGSYVGRVRWFLASISQHVRSYADAVAQSTPGRTTRPTPSRPPTPYRSEQPARSAEPGRVTTPARIEADDPAAAELAAVDADLPCEDEITRRKMGTGQRPLPRPDPERLTSVTTMGDPEPVDVQAVPVSVSWDQVAGDSAWEQAKSVLAVIGLWAIFYQLTRRNAKS